METLNISCSCTSTTSTNTTSTGGNPTQRNRRFLVRSRVAGGSPSSSPSSSSDGFIKRMEQTWLISKQPKPVACSSCQACGRKECPWCKGTGFFILGDNMLCEVSSHNTACYICSGQGVVHCEQCKGTGYRAKWLTTYASSEFIAYGLVSI